MPLFRVESRPKHRADDKPAPRPPAARPPAARPPTLRQRRAPAPAAKGRSNLVPALVAGGLAGLVLVAGVSAYFVARSRGTGSAGPGASVPGTVPPAAPAAAALAPGPINADYGRDAQIALVRGEPYSMARLEAAVRIARTLGKLSGDPVPNFGDAEWKRFQVKIFKRQIDAVLMRQAMQREGLVPPTGPLDDLIQSFLQRVGATDAQLQAEMAANSVTRADVQKWFEEGRTTGFFVQTKLMNGQDPSQREAIVQKWLTDEWSRLEDEILINFYDPDQLDLAPGTRGTSPAAPGSDSANPSAPVAPALSTP